MEKMILVLDESGAKGYAKTQEKYEGEIGLMAGFLYTEEEINKIELMFDSIINNYRSGADGKIHITDLDKNNQKKLRNEVFDAFNKTKLQWFYTAIYAEGFHQSEFEEGRGGSKSKKDSLHAKLFQNMFTMSLSMADSLNKNNLNLIVKTDNIDKGIIKKFKKEAKLISNSLLRKEQEIFNHISDDKTGKFKKNKATISIKCADLMKFEGIKLDIICEYSSITIAADILANSVNYYLRKNQKIELNSHINNKEAIKNHPLVDLAFIPRNKDHVCPILDIVYRRNKT